MSNTEKKPNSKPIIIAAGGTGGHVFPALAVYEELVLCGTKAIFISDVRGDRFLPQNLESKYIIPVKANSGGVLGKLKMLLSILTSTIQCIGLIIKHRPKSIIGFGGYPSFPVVFAGIFCFRDIYIHEQNSVLGKVNKLVAGITKKIFLSFEKTKFITPKLQQKTTYSGNPVRQNIEEFFANNISNNDSDELTILVIGGSQGSNIFNDIVPQTIVKLQSTLSQNTNIIQQVRKDSSSDIKSFYEQNNIKARVQSFFDNMPQILNEADIIICRSGASTIAELTFAAKPTILVPLKNSAHNHQQINAEYLVKNNAAKMILENDFTSKNLTQEIVNITKNQEVRESLSSNLKALQKQRAAKAICSSIVN